MAASLSIALRLVTFVTSIPDRSGLQKPRFYVKPLSALQAETP
jgi:hypothetical protein